MRLLPTIIATAGLSFLTIAPAGAQEDCRAQITALNAAMAEHYPNLFGVAAGDVEPGDDAPETLSGEPPKTLDTPTSEDIPTSVMPGAAPEVELSEEEAAATPGDEEPAGTSPEIPAATAGDSASGNPLPEDAAERAEDVTEQPASGRETGEDSAEAPTEGGEEPQVAGAGDSLQSRVNRVMTLRTLAEERLSTGHDDLCRSYVEQAMAIAERGVE